MVVDVCATRECLPLRQPVPQQPPLRRLRCKQLGRDGTDCVPHPLRGPAQNLRQHSHSQEQSGRVMKHILRNDGLRRYVLAYQPAI